MLSFIQFFLSIFITIIFYFSIGNFFSYTNKTNDFFSLSINGFLIASFISIFLNFFVSLNIYLNSLIIFLAIILFIFSSKLKKKEYLCNIFVVASLSFLIVIYDTVNRPDAYLYHLPFSQILNENKIIFGLSNLHFRFGHVSIFQYLSALNVNIISNLNGLHIPLAVFWSLITLYFLNDVLLYIKKKEAIDVSKIFSLLILTYILLRINRYSEFGNDAGAHLCIFYLISKFLKFKIYDKEKFLEILSISIFAIMNKFFMIFSLIFPFYIFLKLKKKNILLSFPMAILVIWILKNILISGCIVYPASSTCLKNLIWTDKIDTQYQKIQGEAWAKGWPDRHDKFISKKNYIKKFYWINDWSKKNLKVFNKNLIPFLIFSIFLFLIIKINKKDKIKIDYEKLKIIIIFSFIGSLFFMIKFPIYRYGYSYLIVFFISLIITFIYNINLNFFIKVSKVLIFILIIGFIGKNLNRIIKYHSTRSLVPEIIVDKKISLNKFKKYNSNKFVFYKPPKYECGYLIAPCTNELNKTIYHKKFFTYDILYKKY